MRKNRESGKSMKGAENHKTVQKAKATHACRYSGSGEKLTQKYVKSNYKDSRYS